MTLQAAVPGLDVDFQEGRPVPAHIQAAGRFLTPASPGATAAQVVEGYVSRHRAIFGHDGVALSEARIIRDDVTPHNGMTTLVWQQEIEGVPVFEATFKASVTKNGELINIGSQFIEGREAGDGLAPDDRRSLIAHPPVQADGAVTAAAAAVGEEGVTPQPQGTATGSERRQRFTATGLSDVQASLVWVPVADDAPRLAWDVTVTSLKQDEMFRVLVDAQSAQPILLRSLTNDISNATYRVFADAATQKPFDSPKPFAPGPSTPSTVQPPEAARSLIVTPALDSTASPNGWIDDGGTTTLGNNVAAHLDLDFNNQPDLPRPDGGAGRIFDFPLDLTQEPSTYRDAAVTQLFYYCNWMHDRLYQLGFTESAGNFQTNNFGRGGLGNDAVLADAQDGSGTNNANFSTPTDGSPGRMQMYIFPGATPDIDGDFDGQIVLHEYAHGLSNRLVGGGVGMSALQSRGMGEGWSDFYGFALLSQPDDDIHGCYAAGGYATYQLSGLTQNYYFGIRRYPYSTDLQKNPLTFKDIDPTQASAHPGIPSSPIKGAPNADPSQVHAQGEVWCVTLWDVRANLVTKHGYAVGNELALRLVTDGMKLSPANPTFLQARDGILQADLVNNAGADRVEIWTAFAKRGMGVSAYAPASTTTTGLIEAYDLPGDLGVSPSTPFFNTQTAAGVFVPSSITYTLTNNGSLPLNWTAGKTESWSVLSSSGGTLAPGASATVIWSIAPSAVNLAPGVYADTLTVTDLTNDVVKTRPLQLTLTPSLVAVLTQPLNGDPGWTRSGQWAFGTPSGQGGVGGGGAGSADPVSGATGTKVFGINLGGNYASINTTDHLVAGPFNFTGLTAASLRFKRWLNSDFAPFSTQTIDVSTDGSTWTNVWSNGGSILSTSAWSTQTHPLGAGAAGQPTVYIRWGHQTTSSAARYSGWNIDDIEILAHTNTPALVATPQALSTSFGAALPVTLSGVGSGLSYAIATQPAHGQLTGAGASFVYTPDGGFVGIDEFRFTVSSGGNTSVPATVSVAVLGTADIVVSEGGVGLEDGAGSVSVGPVLTGSAQTRRFVIANAGNDLLTLGAPARDGPHAVEFTLATLSATNLEPGDTATLDVTFAPRSTGAKTATLRLASNDPDEAVFDILLSGTASGTGTPVQLRDINSRDAGLTPTAITPMDGFTLFVGSTNASGTELWRTDGTTAGTLMVKEIMPGNASSSISTMVRMGARVYFSATNGVNGSELWTSDGTSVGTVMVKDILAGGGNSSPSNLTVVGSTLFFSASDTATGIELWKSDGSGTGTVQVANINPGSSSSSPSNFYAFEGSLYFSATNGVSGVELWKSDGSSAGTGLVKDISPGSPNSTPALFIGIGPLLYFVANDGVAGSELWKTDGTTAGTEMVADIVPGSTGSSPGVLVNLNGTLYFRPFISAFGFELWKSDGTAAGTVMVKDILPGASSGVVGSMIAADGSLYLSATNSTSGVELWKSDGTAEGTVMLADLASGSGSSSPSNFVWAIGRLYFTATTSVGLELWKTDGTPEGTLLVKDILPGVGNASPTALREVGTMLYFSADDGLSGREMWISDGTSAGTLPLGNFATGTSTSNPANLRNVNGVLYLGATDGLTGQEPWRSTGSVAGTGLVTDLATGTTSSIPGNFTSLGPWAIFSASAGATSTELFRSDGTAAGTALVKDIWSGSSASSPANMANAGSVVYFSANDGTTNSTELWKTDGTLAGTVLVKNINATSGGSSAPVNITAFGNDTVLFAATNGVNGVELWISDGTDAGTVMVKDINAGSASSSPANFTLFNNVMYFSATTATSGSELWRTDGTEGGTLKVTEINSGSNNASPQFLTVVGNALYFSAVADFTAQELWKWDGTSAAIVKDINTGGSSIPSNLVNMNGVLMFSATSGAIAGTELWRSDGTSAGTVMVKDINPGAAASAPSNLVALNGEVYFRAGTTTHGTELWRSDGTAAGTVLVADLLPGSGSSLPSSLTRVANLLYFTATTEEFGTELYMVEAGPPADIAVEQPAGTGLVDGASTVDFGAADVTTAPTKSFTIKNEGSQTLNISGVTIDGTHAAQFSAGQLSASELTAGGSATFTVKFAPISNGVKTAALHIHSDDADEASFDITLTGTGSGEPEIQVERTGGLVLVSGSASVNYSSVTLGGVNSAITFTVRNLTAGTNLSLAKPAITGAAAADFAVNASGMNATVAGGASTSFTVSFAPLATGTRTAALSLTNSDADENPFIITLTGSGVALPGPGQSIAGPAAIPARFAVDGPFTLPWVATSGLPLTATVVAGNGLGSVTGTTFTPNGSAGSVTLRLMQAGGAGYDAAPTIYRSFVLASGRFVGLGQGSTNNHSLGIQADGSLWAWGSGATGVLGVAGLGVRNPVPLKVGTATDWLQVACGSLHTVAIKTDGSLWAWGMNTNGQLGDGSTSQRSTPVRIGTANDWAHVAAGANHTVAIKTNGTLWAWGLNTNSQLGDGTTTQRTSPLQIGSATNWANTSAGTSHSLAVRTDGTLWSWGFNGSSQLGLGDTTTRTSPTQIGSGTAWRTVAAANTSSYAIQTNGTLWAWGFNGSFQLGDGTTTTRSAPVQIGAATDWQALALGSNHSVGLRGNGTLWSWGGANGTGQTAHGNSGTRTVPSQVGTDSDWVAIGGGSQHTTALKSDGTMWAAGLNSFGQTAYPLANVSAIATGGVQSMTQGTWHTHFIRENGTLWGIGSNFNDLGDGTTTPRRQPVQIGSASNWLQVAAGNGHTIGVRADGSLWGNGGNTNGQVGDNSTTSRTSFVSIGATTDWAKVGAGSSHSMAIKSDGSLWTWGSNSSGQLGHGDTTQRLTPTRVGTGTDWAVVTGGGTHTLALKNDGTLWAWGLNFNGQLGLGDTTQRSAPTQVGTANQWIAISAGSIHSMGLRADGTVWSWGGSSNLQIGDGGSSNRLTPFQMSAATDWVAIFAGNTHSVAINAKGEMWGCGQNSSGQLGQTTSNSFNTLNLTAPGKIWKSFGTGPGTFTLALSEGGNLWGFGSNADAQLSDHYRLESFFEYGHPNIALQTVTVPNVLITTFGTPVTLSGTTTSGLPISYAASGPAMINGDQLTVTGPGEVKLVAWQRGDRPAWHSSPPVQVPVISIPAATTVEATAIGPFEATLHASAFAGGQSATAAFEFDTDISDGSYAFSVAATPGSLSGSGNTPVTASLVNLNRGTLYHFRVRVTNALGTAYGDGLTFTTPNTAPVAQAQTVNGTEDIQAAITLTGTDAEVDPLSFTITAAPAKGNLTGTPPALTYVPHANVNGADSFSFKVNDGLVDSPAAVVTVNLAEVNDAPVAASSFAFGNEDSVITGGLSALDIEQDALSFAKVTDPAHGSISVGIDGAFIYTPNQNFNGSDNFTFQASDGFLNSNTATVTITVNAVNDAPVAFVASASGNEDAAAITGAVTATDVEEDELTFAKVTNPAHGTATVNANGTFSYTPNLNYNGIDSFTVKANDGWLDSNVVTVTITINGVNDAPVAAAASTSGDEDATAITGTAPATDVDAGAELTYAKVTNPSHGTATVNANGSFSYTPNLNYNGTDSFTFKANDGLLDSNTATVTITVNAVNDAPVAIVASASGDEDAAAITGKVTATDIEEDELTFAKVTSPSHGSATVNADGTFSYTPNLNYNGTDTFTVKANDDVLDSNTVTVTITINAVNDAPVAAAAAASGDEDAAAITGTASATDVDAGAVLTYAKVSNPAHGTATVNANGTFSYTPNLNYNGTDSFTFKANDGLLDSNTATVTITVNAVNDAPVAAVASASGDEDAAAITGAVTATDIEADDLTFAKVTNPGHGAATVNPDGTFSYTPNLNYNGTDAFTVKANDGLLDSNIITVTITLNAVNDAPVAAAASGSGDEDAAAITGSVTATDIDAGAELTYAKVANPVHGTATVNADGTFSYTPNLNYNGTDSFTFKANDGLLDSNTATVTITVNAVNDAPVAAIASASGDEDAAAITGAVTATDIEADDLIFAKVTNPAHGAATVNADGTFSYKPNLNYNGTDTFTVKTTDGELDSNTITVTITINAVNDAPVAAAAATSGEEDAAAITGAVTATDVEDDDLTFAKVSGPSHGSATVADDGTFSYAPELDYNGFDTFTVKANDGALDSNTVTVTIAVGAVNDAPIASSGEKTGNEDTVLSGNLAANDIDIGDVLTYVKVSDPTHGTVTIDSATGAYIYTPAPNSNGADSFTFKVSDGELESNTATVSLTITAVNDPPVVADASAVGVEGNLVRGLLTGTDIENSPLTFALVADAPNGRATVNADGAFSYRPNPEFVGTDTFTFNTSDGTDHSNTGTITVVITTILPEWTWMQGANTPNQKSGTTGGTLSPGARQGAATWTDNAGAYWLFGGSGFGKTTGPGMLNDLWRRDPATGLWSLIKGAEEVNVSAVYGTQGIPAEANLPGPRNGAAAWLDGAGKLWLFGGSGRDGAGATGPLNDLWCYDVAASTWTWIKGSSLTNSTGSYGVRGTPDPANTPGARGSAVAWVDAQGGAWVFGGRGLPASGAKAGLLNDLWRYDSSVNKWTWMHGSSTLDGTGNYGSPGLATAANQPGARGDAAAWKDVLGNFWLFGGSGFAASGTPGNLSDLWKFDPAMNQWTWMRGPTTTNSAGVYGSLGVTAGPSQPGARHATSTWTDAAGALWLFGGTGQAASGSGLLSDVWRYDPATNLWTWMKGSSATNGPANYGALGIAAPANTPSARRAIAAFTDGAGDLWLFGGLNGSNHYSDLWRLDLPPAPVVRILPAQFMRAAVTGNGLATTAHFRYSRHRDLSDAVVGPEQTIGPDGGEVSMEPQGLVGSATYFYQAVATNAFGTGVSSLGSFTTPGEPVLPTASFAQPAASVTEDGGTVNVLITMNGSSATAFSIPFTLSGSATAGAAADYTVPVSPIVFVAGQTSATISIPVSDDVLDEEAESILISLGAPTGGVALGPIAEFSLTIEDNDTAIEITTPPQSQFVALGATTTLSVEATGSGLLTYQWKKDDKDIKGATAARYVINGTPLTAMGNYTVAIKNPVGTMLSPTAELSVIDASSRTLAIAPNGSATMTVVTASPGLVEHQWFRGDTALTTDGTHIIGATSKTLNVKKLTTADAGAYTCLVKRTGTSLQASSGVTTLAVVTLKPAVLAIDALPTGTVGAVYEHPIPFNLDPSMAPSGFTVTGLPGGLTVSASGYVNGRPIAAVTDKTITITAKNSAGSSPPEVCTLTIQSLPTATTGVYIAQVDRHAQVNAGHGGRIDVTTTTAGSFSVKLTTAAGAVSATGGLLTPVFDHAGPDAGIVGVTGFIAIPRKNQSTLHLVIFLDASDNTLSGSLTDTATDPQVPVNGFRQVWHATTNKATAYTGYYTLGLEIPSTSVGDQSVPQGNGFASFIAKSNGTLTLTGQAADGQTFTTAAFLSADGIVPVFVPFATVPGSFLGTADITPSAGPAFATSLLSGNLTWSKSPATVGSKSRVYRAGFEPLPLSVIGGKYAPPSAGQVILALANNANNADLTFAEGGLLPGQCPPFIFSIRNNNPKGAAQTITLPKLNPNKITFALAANPAGQFSGKFTLPHAVTALSRTLTYQGMIIRSGGSLQAAGYFLLPVLPQPGETLTNSPQMSGQVMLQPAPSP